MLKKWHLMFDEVFVDIKQSVWPRGFTFASITRCSLWVILMVFSSNIKSSVSPSAIKVYILVTVQACYLAWIILVRPFDKTESNLIQIWNETIFLILASYLIFINNDEKWTKTAETIYIQIITNSVFVVFLIVFGKSQAFQ